ncbi:hypothetical protein ACPZ19_38505 [Amycolatopsis lurida]
MTHGRIEETTSAPATGVRLATVRTAEGVLIVGRAEVGMTRGDWVPLSRHDGVAGALYIPESDHS